MFPQLTYFSSSVVNPDNILIGCMFKMYWSELCSWFQVSSWALPCCFVHEKVRYVTNKSIEPKTATELNDHLYCSSLNEQQPFLCRQKFTSSYLVFCLTYIDIVISLLPSALTSTLKSVRDRCGGFSDQIEFWVFNWLVAQIVYIEI